MIGVGVNTTSKRITARKSIFVNRKVEYAAMIQGFRRALADDRALP